MALAEFEALPEDWKKLIEGAISIARDSSWLPYLHAGASPEHGGFDCSGAMYYVMRKAGLVPPRSSAAQFLWLKENKRLQASQDLKELRPGDLLFWGKSN